MEYEYTELITGIYSSYIADEQSTTFVVPGMESSTRAFYEATSLNGVLRYRYLFPCQSTLGVSGEVRSAKH